MVRRIVFLLCCLQLLCCTDHNVTNNDEEIVMLKACSACNTSKENMEWLRDLLRQSQSDFSLRGPIYTVNYNGQPLFVHQRFILSCVPCTLLDCQGALIQSATVDAEQVRSQMTEENLIYNPSLD